MKNKWLQSFFIVLCLFLLVNVFLHSLFNSGDDVFLMYTLGGGFGEAPSNLLHYDHIWHPILSWIVKTLFINFPTINWYTVFLTAFQIMGCTTILYVFLKKFKWDIAFLLFIILFVFFEVRILLSLNFTATSWLLAASGYLLLFQYVLNQRKAVDLLFSCFLLLLSGLLRLHILFVVTALFLPAFFLYASKKYKTWLPVILTICVAIFLLNLQHKSFYKKNISGWQAEENRRQTLFYAYNRPLHTDKPINEVFGDSITRAFYLNYFFYDSNIISTEKMKGIVHSLARHRDFSIREDTQVLYWTFMEYRVYILLLFIIFFLLWQLNILKIVLRRWLITSILVFGMYGYLLLFLKVTESIYLGAVMLMWIFLCLAIPEDKIEISKKKFRYSSLILILPFTWIIIRVIKKDKENKQNHQRFECVVKEIKNNPDKLFITTDNNLPLDFFYIWDSPIKYQLPNLVNRDRVMNDCFKPTLQKFGITDIMKAIYENENVFLLGRDFQELKDYYKKKEGISVSISPVISEYKCLEVRKLSLAQ